MHPDAKMACWHSQWFWLWHQYMGERGLVLELRNEIVGLVH